MMPNIWFWLAKFAAPLGLAFLSGFVLGGKSNEEATLRAEIRAMERAAGKAEADIAANARAAVEAAARAREAEERRNLDREDFRTALAAARRPIPGACVFSDVERERLRDLAGAANRFVAGDVPGGTRDAEGGV